MGPQSLSGIRAQVYPLPSMRVDRYPRTRRHRRHPLLTCEVPPDQRGGRRAHNTQVAVMALKAVAL
jgi:hypothetical protein